jgi:glycosyltransferase involved in cell wall biosynthesis
VRFLGFCKDIISVYQNSNLVVLPSYREGLPRSLVEAGACGRAVITTDVPGCRDAIIPGSTGLLVNVKDSTSLANAIEQLLQSPDLRKSLGKSGRRFAEKNFDIRIIVRQHLKLYDELTNLSVSSALRK